ncbi:tripartite tricarboxylate transporter TctB family protein [Bacillus sp. ISL-47]|uniref:tripartite tricarboxylate transporter TctB family protein n=1 Tax=Bacillus sp. ISL-47 TaxID=2819130 RepID=UPI001BEBB221|nr:tripartite tricarboxylate transporter TctB family protein [Bacillus sp. ISL-47]MBT2689677.1 tripartite tricarboxylate transporter TctB family protein [Bacillus sp. ISL-47]MBT2709323.1 tripartite tricarboxylate transporter TctB family protein [Pseudomonas sp. ISL-84]
MLTRINQKMALILAVIAGVYLILSYNLPKYPNAIIDADVVPKGLGFLLLFFAILLFLDKKEETEAEKQKRSLSKSNLFVLLAVLAFILVYISLLEVLGFLIMTTLFIFSCSLFLGYKKHLANGIVSVVFSLAIYGLFNYLLRINLPAGIIPF